jgi:hypothetical protein
MQKKLFQTLLIGAMLCPSIQTGASPTEPKCGDASNTRFMYSCSCSNEGISKCDYTKSIVKGTSDGTCCPGYVCNSGDGTCSKEGN